MPYAALSSWRESDALAFAAWELRAPSAFDVRDGPMVVANGASHVVGSAFPEAVDGTDMNECVLDYFVPTLSRFPWVNAERIFSRMNLACSLVISSPCSSPSLPTSSKASSII